MCHNNITRQMQGIVGRALAFAIIVNVKELLEQIGDVRLAPINIISEVT